MGRVDRYETHVKPHLNYIAKWKVYKTEEQIAEMLGVSYSTFQKYKKQHDELNFVCLFGNKDKLDSIESAMTKRAEGYDYYEIREVIDKDGQIRELKTLKHVPADPRAAKWLHDLYDPNGELAFEVIKQKEELELKKNKDRREEEDNW